MDTLNMDKGERRHKETVLARYLLDNINTHNIWAVKMFIVKIIYFINIVVNLLFMDIFLGEFLFKFLFITYMKKSQMDSSTPMDSK